MSRLDKDRLRAAWQEAVFALDLAEGKIEPEVVENMRTWPHSSFSVDQSVFLAAGDRAGIERLVQYMTRCPFSLSGLVEVTSSGQVVYKAEKDACRPFPDPEDEGLGRGVKRNFQIPSPLDFLEVWWPDERDCLDQAATAGGDREDPATLRLVGSVAVTGAADRRGIGPRRRAPGLDVGGRSDVLILPDGGGHRDVACQCFGR
ncbi:MAG: transposase [Pirellulales bacterium]|nr:transposase [Pirellulales bacterium]